MPKDELCHICYVRKLAIMQSSQYSVYNEFYKEQLEYVYAQCGGSGPTDIPPPLTEQEPEPEPYCVTGKHYTTEEGDTCESIANATSVSGAALYMGNQELLPNCLDVDAGLSVCVPLTCETFYVRPSDTCITIEKALEMDFGQLTLYNSWINVACTNLQAATDFYGKNICVSPQGGTFTGTVPPPAATSNPGLDDGYTRNPVASPEDVPVAEGTTLNCGRWHIVDAGDTCSEICMQNTIATSLFHAVNPSLESESCTLSLQPQTALCVGPTYSWNSTEPVTTTADDTTGATRTEAPTSVA